MPESRVITFRCPDSLLKHAKRRAKANNLDLGGHVRALLAADAGVKPPEMPAGFHELPESRQKKLASMGGKKSRKPAKNKDLGNSASPPGK